MTPQHAATEAAAAQINAQMQLRALHERREMISDQYQNAMGERGRVGQERMNAQARGDANMVKEYDGVLERIGKRMQEIERTMATVDKQIDEAMKAPVVAEEVVAVPPPPPVAINIPPSFDFDVGSLVNPSDLVAQRAEYQRMMVAEGAVLLMLGALLWRFGVARGRRQAMRAEAPRTDERLQQAVDAIAIEVERLSEGQRFINNVLSAKRPEREAVPVQRAASEPRDSAWVTPH